MYDGIFFVNHALKVKALSVFSEEERFEQTLETLNSINKYCPNNRVFIFDSSPEQPKEEYLKELADRGAVVFYSGGEPDVNGFSSIGSYASRSIAETISFIYFLSWFKTQDIRAKRIYKISGRYRLSDNFVLNDPSYDDAFVFAKSHESWMNEDQRKKVGTDRLYLLRLWHMDYSLLDTFDKELRTILLDCINDKIDVEHAYYKNLHTYKTIELDKIGVCGNIAPSGDYIDE